MKSNRHIKSHTNAFTLFFRVANFFHSQLEQAIFFTLMQCCFAINFIFAGIFSCFFSSVYFCVLISLKRQFLCLLNLSSIFFLSILLRCLFVVCLHDIFHAIIVVKRLNYSRVKRANGKCLCIMKFDYFKWNEIFGRCMEWHSTLHCLQMHAICCTIDPNCGRYQKLKRVTTRQTNYDIKIEHLQNKNIDSITFLAQFVAYHLHRV